MKEAGSTATSRHRLATWALVAAIAAAGLWGAWTFGPRPVAATVTPASAAAPAVPRTQPAAERTPGILPGMERARVEAGVFAGSPSQYLDTIEHSYLERGYRRMNGQTALPQGSPRAFWRIDSPMSMIVAIGPDASPNGAAPPGAVAAYMTCAMPTQEGTAWTVYRHDGSTSKDVANLSMPDPNGDFPGADPPGIPRAPGSRRLLVIDRMPSGVQGTIAIYEIAAPRDEVRRYYADQLVSRSWRLDANATSQVSRIGDGALVFTQGERICLMWVAANDVRPDSSTIVVSCR